MNCEIRFQGGGKPITTGFMTPHVHGKDEPDDSVNDSLDSDNTNNDQKTGSKWVEGANKRAKD
jgi:hypothetical protein